MGLSRAQVREIDRRAIEEFGMPGLVLMENAGRGAAELLLSLGIHGSVAICCGKGNNGGDGLVMARHLDNRGAKVLVHLYADPAELSPDAAVQWHIVSRSGIGVAIWQSSDLDETQIAADFSKAEWIVDALFGTGLTGPIRPPLDRVIDLVNASRASVFAVDIPSGLGCDTGEPIGPTVRARHTATFVATKKGYDNPAARAWLGKVHVVDIGAPKVLLEGTL